MHNGSTIVLKPNSWNYTMEDIAEYYIVVIIIIFPQILSINSQTYGYRC